jgi:hypothetical protein
MNYYSGQFSFFKSTKFSIALIKVQKNGMAIKNYHAHYDIGYFASPKSSPKERTLTSLFFRTLSFGEGRVRQPGYVRNNQLSNTIN